MLKHTFSSQMRDKNLPNKNIPDVDATTLECYPAHPSGDPSINLISWEGLTSATQTPEKALLNLTIYGCGDASRKNILFVIEPEACNSIAASQGFDVRPKHWREMQ